MAADSEVQAPDDGGPVARSGTAVRRGLVGAAISVLVLVVAGVAFALTTSSAPSPTAGASPSQTPTVAPPPANATGTPDGAATTRPATSAGPAGTPPAPMRPPGGGNPPAGLSRPAAPTGFVAETVSSSRIRLRWTDNANNEDGFTIVQYDRVQRIDLGANTTSYLLMNLPPNGRYCYAVAAFNAAGWSGGDPFPPDRPEEYVCGQTAVAQVPPPPTNVTVAPYSNIDITVRFTSATTDLTEFGISVMDAKGHEITRATVPARDTFDYEVQVVVPEVRETAVDYCVKMSAHHQVAGWSGWSNTACTAMPPWPNPPSGLTATVNGTTVHLQWTDNSAIETMYEVWALGVAGRTLPPNSTWYDWTGLAPATNYCFLVIARNATGPNGAPQVCVTTGGG